MKVKSRIISMFLFLALAAACFTGLIATHAFTAKADSTLPTTSSFETLNEAEIRQVDPYGIRFTTRISSSEYEGLINYYGEENVKFGTLIGRGTSYDALKASGKKVERSMWVGGYDPSTASASEYRYNLAIVGLQDANLNSYYIALGYVEITDTVTNPGEPTTKTVYATVQNDFKRTPLQVASAYVKDLVADGELDVDDEQHQYLLNIVDKVIDGETVKPTFAEETFTVKCLETATPQVTVGGVPVSATYTVNGDTVAEVQNGAIYAKNAGNTTVTATIKGLTKDYTCTATLNVEKNVAEPYVNKDGTLTLATGGVPTTVKVNGAVAQENVTADTFNVVEYILTDKAPTATTTYDITVDSANATGATTHTLVPVNNSNFVSAISTLQAQSENKTFFLTEDIVLNPWTSTSQGAFTGSWGGRFISRLVYVNLNGMGHSIRYSVQATGTTDTSRLRGIAYELNGFWQNIHFDVSVSADAMNAVVFDYLANGAGLVNCYFDIESSGTASAIVVNRIFPDASFKNNVFKIDNYAGVTAYALSQANGQENPFDLSELVIVGNSDKVQPIAKILDLSTLTSEIDVDFYPTASDFLNKTNGTNYVKKNGYSSYETSTSITDADYSDWSKWTFDSENGTIKLCGETVYDANATKGTATATIGDDGILTIENGGELSTVYANDQVIAQGVLNTFDIGAYARAQGWITVEGTTVNIKVESKGYTCELEHTFRIIELTLTADDKGVITFDVDGEVATVKVNGNVVDGATASPFDLSAYHFASANANSSVEYTVVVTSNSYYGEITYNFVALTQENFISTLRASDVTIATATGGDATGRTFFLAEDVTIDAWESSTDLGDFNQNFFEARVALAGYGAGLYANLDGRGHKISLSYNHQSSSTRIGGFIGNLYGLWYNIAFDVDFLGDSTSHPHISLVCYNVVAGGFEDCYFDISSQVQVQAFVFSSLATGQAVNCIFDFNAVAGGNIFVVVKGGGNAVNNRIVNCVIIDNTVDQTSSVMANEGVKVSSGFINFVNTYRYRNIENGYTAKQAFFNSGACSSIAKGWTTDTEGVTATEVAAGSSITTLITWGSAWEITSNTVKLCGTTVLSANA